MGWGCPAGKGEARSHWEDDRSPGSGGGLEGPAASCPALGEQEAFRAQLVTSLCLQHPQLPLAVPEGLYLVPQSFAKSQAPGSIRASCPSSELPAMQGSTDPPGRRAGCCPPARKCSPTAALPFPAAPLAPTLAAEAPTPALNAAGLARLCWPQQPAGTGDFWPSYLWVPLGPTAGIREASGFVEGSAADVLSEEGPGHGPPLISSSAPPRCAWGTNGSLFCPLLSPSTMRAFASS